MVIWAGLFYQGIIPFDFLGCLTALPVLRAPSTLVGNGHPLKGFLMLAESFLYRGTKRKMKRGWWRWVGGGLTMYKEAGGPVQFADREAPAIDPGVVGMVGEPGPKFFERLPGPSRLP